MDEKSASRYDVIPPLMGIFVLLWILFPKTTGSAFLAFVLGGLVAGLFYYPTLKGLYGKIRAGL